MDPNNNLRPSWFAAVTEANEGMLEEIVKVQPGAILYVDEQGSSALHLSVENDHFNVVKMLVDFNSNLCMMRDREGRTALHIAASKGLKSIIELILSRTPGSFLLLTNQNESILHSCVKANNSDAFQFIVKKISNPDAIINCRDSAGDTILHLAAAKRDFEMVKYLVENTSIDVNAVNGRGSTALDTVTRRSTKKIRIYDILAAAGAKSGPLQVGQMTLHNGEASRSKDDNWQAPLAVTFLSVACSGILSHPGGIMIAIIVSKIFRDMVVYSSLTQLSRLIRLSRTNCPLVLNSPLPYVTCILMQACPAFFAIAYMNASWDNCILKEINLAMVVFGCIMLGSVYIELPLTQMKIMKSIFSTPEQTAQQEEASDSDIECPV